MNDNNFDNKYRYDAFFENELWLKVNWKYTASLIIRSTCTSGIGKKLNKHVLK